MKKIGVIIRNLPLGTVKNSEALRMSVGLTIEEGNQVNVIFTDEGVLTLNDAVARLTSGPAQVLGLDRGTLAVGSAADVTIIDPDCTWTLHAVALASKSKNTPFDGWKLKGAASHTLVDGRIVYSRDEA